MNAFSFIFLQALCCIIVFCSGGAGEAAMTSLKSMTSLNVFFENSKGNKVLVEEPLVDASRQEVTPASPTAD